MPERLIELAVSQIGAGPDALYGFHLTLDGTVIAANRQLDLAQSREARRLSRAFGQLFEGGRLPRLTRGQLAAIGTQLFDLWLAPSWPGLSAQLRRGDSPMLVVAAESADVLNLPWEVLRPAGGEAIGADGRWGLRRLPFAGRPLDPAETALPPGPLRVFHMVCAPQDQHELDFEREEELMLRAFGKAGGSVVFDSGDLGTFEELEERILAFRPHIVHLTGHGAVEGDTAYLCFEDESGRTDPRSTAEVGGLFAGSGVQCAFLSACQAGKAPAQAALGGLAQGLIAQGVPLVIGWAASILDDVAVTVAGRFYGAVSAGRTTIDRALVAARQAAAREPCAARDDPSWSLPVLYAGSRQSFVFDAARREPATRPSLAVQSPLEGMTEGSAEQFVGRRREVQALLPGLRSGAIHAVLLTGLGGAGKSTLATRLARKLEADGWTPLPLPSSETTPLSAARVLEALARAYLAASHRAAHDPDLAAAFRATHETLQAASVSVSDRLHLALAMLNRGRFVLVLDNFETNLDEGSRRILDAELAGFYRHLIGGLVGGSRLIVTSRHRPSDVEPLPRNAVERGLAEFGEAAFLKFLLRDAAIERRYRAGDLPHGLLTRLYRLLGATPRFLGQIRTVLAEMPAGELAAELDRVALPDAGEAAPAGRLQAARDAYCETIFTGRLYARLPEDAKALLSRAAVYGLPVTVEALAALTGEPEAAAARSAALWRDLALAQVERGTRDLWSVYGMLRGWLLAPERLDRQARRAAHEAAGDFLVELNRQDREGELGVNWVRCRLEARAQYIAAGALDKARDVSGAISNAYRRQGLYAELARLHSELLHLEEHPDTLNWLGHAAVQQARYGLARTSFERALMLAGETDSEASVLALHNLATIDLREGAYASARAGFAKVLAIRQQIGDQAGEAGTLHQIATTDLNEGAYASARAGFAKALAILQQVGDRAGEAVTLHQIATIDLNESAYASARGGFGKALAILRQIRDRAGEAATLHQIASIDVNEGAYASARGGFGKALAIRQQIGDQAGEAATLHNLATIDFWEGAYALAREGFAKSLAIKQQIGNRAGEAATWFQLGSLAVRQGNAADGLRMLGLCFMIDQAIGHGDTDNDFRAVAAVADQLGYTPEQLKAVLEETAEAYSHDRGAALLAQAFAPDRLSDGDAASPPA